MNVALIITFLSLASHIVWAQDTHSDDGTYDCTLTTFADSLEKLTPDFVVSENVIRVNNWGDCAQAAIDQVKSMDDYVVYAHEGSRWIWSRKGNKWQTKNPVYVWWNISHFYPADGHNHFSDSPHLPNGKVTKYTRTIAEGDQRMWANFTPWK